jgi:hypothetical protein
MAYLTAEAEKWADEMTQLASECTSLLGRDLTAYICGASYPQELDAWINTPDETARIARERLEAARRIATVFAPDDRAEMVAWFRDLDPMLGGISPATALRVSATSHVHALLYAKAVRHASAALVTSGAAPRNGAVPPR